MTILLNELSEWFARKQHPLANVLQKIRCYVLIPLALLLVVTKVLKLENVEAPLRLLETITWIAVIFAAIPLLNAILTPKNPIRWQLKVPQLFFQVTRAFIVLGIAYYILGKIWNVNMTGLATAAGVGSLVIALALQDTLSNLVSGFLLLMAKPFEVGDWIKCNELEARVVEQNWWSVTLEHKRWKYKITIPNGILAKSNITNYLKTGKWMGIPVSFSYKDPPNKVTAAMNRLTKDIDEIVSGVAVIDSYKDSKIDYKIWCEIVPDEALMTLNKIKSRIYYMAKRENFMMPYWTQVQRNFEDEKASLPFEHPTDQPKIIARYLQSLPVFIDLSLQEIEQFAAQTSLRYYGIGELILQEGQAEDGLYILFKGNTRAWTLDFKGQLHEVNRFVEGDMFWEVAIFHGEVSPITVTATKDVEAIMILKQDMIALIQKNALFGREMNQFIEERKRVIRLMKGASNKNERQE